MCTSAERSNEEGVSELIVVVEITRPTIGYPPRRFALRAPTRHGSRCAVYTLHGKTMCLLSIVTTALFVHNGNMHEDNGPMVQPLAIVGVPAAIASCMLLQRVCVGRESNEVGVADNCPGHGSRWLS